MSAHPNWNAGRPTGTFMDRELSPLGVLIRRHLAEHRMSQSKIAERAGFDASYVSRICSGDRDPSRDAVLALAAAFDLTPSETDELLAAGGFLPVDPLSLIANEPELAAVLTVLRNDALPDTYRDAVRVTLMGLARTAQIERIQDVAATSPQSAATPSKGIEQYVGALRPSQAVTAPIPRVPADDLLDALTTKHGKAAA